MENKHIVLPDSFGTYEERKKYKEAYEKGYGRGHQQGMRDGEDIGFRDGRVEGINELLDIIYNDDLRFELVMKYIKSGYGSRKVMDNIFTIISKKYENNINFKMYIELLEIFKKHDHGNYESYGGSCKSAYEQTFNSFNRKFNVKKNVSDDNEKPAKKSKIGD